jgi:hypothetical protein
VHHPGIAFLRRARAQQIAARSLIVPFVLLFATACPDDRGDGTAQARTARQSSAGAVELPSVAYKPVTLGSVGSIEGTVEIDGEAPADSVVTPSVDQEPCGTGFPDSSIVRRGSKLASAVVWLTDVKEGKTLPVERRTEIVNQDCRLVPRVQAVVVGTTVNVRNEDRLAHTTRFVRGGAGGDTLARIPLTDDGQVVPNEHLAAKSGLVAATCVQHPWTRGFIAVFESPYFALTDADGGFRLDSIPPGTYHLRVWHERSTSAIEREVTVSAAGVSRVELKLKLR